MASYSVTKAKHATLVAATVDTVTLNPTQTVVVQNRGASGDIYFTLGIDGATATAPTSAGDDTYYVGPSSAILIDPDAGSVSSVKLISAGTPAYTVMGF